MASKSVEDGNQLLTYIVQNPLDFFHGMGEGIAQEFSDNVDQKGLGYTTGAAIPFVAEIMIGSKGVGKAVNTVSKTKVLIALGIKSVDDVVKFGVKSVDDLLALGIESADDLLEMGVKRSTELNILGMKSVDDLLRLKIDSAQQLIKVEIKSVTDLKKVGITNAEDLVIYPNN